MRTEIYLFCYMFTFFFDCLHVLTPSVKSIWKVYMELEITRKRQTNCVTYLFSIVDPQIYSFQGQLQGDPVK